MYREKIRNLEMNVNNLSQKIEKLKLNENYDKDQMDKFKAEYSSNMSELSRLRKLQWEEDYERVKFDDH